MKTRPACAKALGIRYDKVSIEPAVAGLTWSLKDLFAGTNADITEENLQSRVRGTILMAISNKFGAMVVTTGNKSEMSVGYATLYGDMNGGFNPIKDLYKTEVYALTRWRNAHAPVGGLGPQGAVIPERILTKAPTAELRANQTDQDSLPPYEELDDILSSLVENELPLAAVIARGHAPETVRRVRAAALPRRVQASPGGAGRQDFGPQLRPRSALSDHQPVSRRTDASCREICLSARCDGARRQVFGRWQRGGLASGLHHFRHSRCGELARRIGNPA